MPRQSGYAREKGDDHTTQIFPKPFCAPLRGSRFYQLPTRNTFPEGSAAQPEFPCRPRITARGGGGYEKPMKPSHPAPLCSPKEAAAMYANSIASSFPGSVSEQHEQLLKAAGVITFSWRGGLPRCPSPWEPTTQRQRHSVTILHFHLLLAQFEDVTCCLAGFTLQVLYSGKQERLTMQCNRLGCK